MACPFGTIADDLFEAKSAGWKFIDLRDENKIKEFAGCYPEDVVSLTDKGEDPEKNIYRLTEHILIKEQTWQSHV